MTGNSVNSVVLEIWKTDKNHQKEMSIGYNFRNEFLRNKPNFKQGGKLNGYYRNVQKP
jgi:hypothetical protein